MNDPRQKVGELVGQLATVLLRIDANQDKKISTLEIMNAVQVIAFKAFEVFGSLDAIRQAFQDFTPEDLVVVLDGFDESFDLTDDEWEVLIERTLEWIAEGALLITDIAAHFRSPTS